MHNPDDLIRLFNACFASSENTQLIRGDDEPIYLPADEQTPYHRVVFAHGYFSSALHECAHWLIAGEARRRCIDYGYWYVPDGRTAVQQAQFQQVEVKPQAMEWILSEAAGFRFHFSVDNLNGESTDSESFQLAVQQQVLQYQTLGLSIRAERFRQALRVFYG
ncbi:MAG TPA: diaminobutyrate-2-oxoglutarate aminotransferase [Legionella sp.]|nr:diaminobutyrate-2-oxoglutarate aminotransferase [Legionella sp.]